MATASLMHNRARVQTIHPAWCLLTIPAMICLLGSDAGNNLSIVPMFASGELSLWSWQGLALGCALSSAPLGYAASRNRLYWFPCLMVILLSGFLTLLSTGTDFSSRSASASNYQATTQGLIQERTALLDNLPSCRTQRWCDSQAKERRVSEINQQLSQTPAQVDPLATPNGIIFAQIIGWLRAFGVPFLVAALGNCLGMMFHGRFTQVSATQKTAAAPAAQGKYEENDLNFSENKPPELSVKQSVERARKWLEKQEAGRVSKQKLKVASRARPKTLSAVVKELTRAGDLIRYPNGQLAKPSKELALPENVFDIGSAGK